VLSVPEVGAVVAEGLCSSRIDMDVMECVPMVTHSQGEKD